MFEKTRLDSLRKHIEASELHFEAVEFILENHENNRITVAKLEKEFAKDARLKELVIKACAIIEGDEKKRAGLRELNLTNAHLKQLLGRGRLIIPLVESGILKEGDVRTSADFELNIDPIQMLPVLQADKLENPESY